MTAHLAAMLVLGTAAAQPDAPGSIRGIVRDQQGGVIAGARVEIVCGSERRRTMTGFNGEFVENGLPGGRCTVSADSPLFAPAAASVDVGGPDRRVSLVSLVLPLRGFATEVVVTATPGIVEERLEIPQGTSVTTREQIDARPYQLLAQSLREEPGILLQQTTSAQTSPIIRGFTGQSNAYLVDGVRLNTASWRSGPSQYLAWVDGASVDRFEIVRGPGSVQYGSDALGGTISLFTARPPFLPGGVRVSGDVEAGLGSAERSEAGKANLTLQGPVAAFRLGASGQRVGDIRPGRGIDSHNAVTRFLGLPSTVLGDRLKDTGYDQTGGYISGHVRAGRNATVSTVYMHESQRRATRYDRIYGGDGLYRSGFDPQTLDFGFVRYDRRNAAGFDALSATLSVNRQADGRFEQTRPTAVLDRQQGTTTAVGYQVQGNRRIGSRQRLATGAELYDESVRSAFREQVNPVTGAVAAQRPDIPNGTTYSSLGAFAQEIVDAVPGRVNVRGGVRFARFAFATVADRALGVIDERVIVHAVTFNAGTAVTLNRHATATFSVSRGFRAPNASDLGGIGLSGGGGFGITPSRAAALGGLVGTTVGTDAVSTGQPVPALGPEALYAFEPGVRFRAGRVAGSLTAYDLEFMDTVQRRAIVFPAGIVGSTISGYQVVRQDANGLAYIAQDIRPIGTSVNVDRSRIVGFEAESSAQLAARWTAFGYFSMSNGRLLATSEPIRRMPPPMGGARLRWSGARTWVEGVMTFARAQTRLNSGDSTDARIGAARTRASIATYFNGTATDLGLVRGGVLAATGETLAQVQTRLLGSAASAPLFTEAPGFVELGARANVRVLPQLDVTVIGANLTDRNYRLYGSGVDAPGVNIQIRTRYRF